MLVHAISLAVLSALFMAAVCFAAYAFAIGAHAMLLQYAPVAVIAGRAIVRQGLPVDL